MKKLFLCIIALLCITTSASAGIVTIPMSVREIIIQDLNGTSDPTIIYTNSWSDDNTAVQLRYSWIGLLIRVTNNTDQPMMLSWNKSAYIDINGNSHRMMPGETRNLFTAQSIPETMIPPHTSYAPLACADNYYVNRDGSYRLILDYPLKQGLFGPTGIQTKKTSSAYKKFARTYSGRMASMMLCLNFNNEDHFYKFDLSLDFDKELDSVEDKNNLSPKIALGIILNKEKIQSVQENSIAAKSGIVAGDSIVEVNGKKFAEVDQPQQYIEAHFNNGNSVMLLIDRNGKQEMITLKKDK